MKVMPPGHPYTSGNCGKLGAAWHTLSAMQKIQLAGQADKCRAKKTIKEIAQYKQRILTTRNSAKQWAKENIPKHKRITFDVGVEYMDKVSVSRGNIKTLVSKGHDLAAERNEAVMKLKTTINKSKYHEWAYDEIIDGVQKHPDVKWWQYYEVDIAGQKSYICVKHTKEGLFIPYSIEQESEFLKIKGTKKGKPGTGG